MAAITSENASAWQQLANDLAPQRPSVGKWVRVIGGRKQKGRWGRVTRHQRTKFGSPTRYCTEASLHMQDMMGTHGFCVQVQPYDGDKPFWVNAEYVRICRPCEDADKCENENCNACRD